MFSSAAWKIINHNSFAKIQNRKAEVKYFGIYFLTVFYREVDFLKPVGDCGNCEDNAFFRPRPWQMADGSCLEREKNKENTKKKYLIIYIIKILLIYFYLFSFSFKLTAICHLPSCNVFFHHRVHRVPRCFLLLFLLLLVCPFAFLSVSF